jgi:2-keto-3-deoxy-galactonokinase
MSDHTLIIDGGTTNTRITLLGPDRQALDVEKKDVGVSQTAVDGHNGK